MDDTRYTAANISQEMKMNIPRPDKNVRQPPKKHTATVYRCCCCVPARGQGTAVLPRTNYRSDEEDQQTSKTVQHPAPQYTMKRGHSRDQKWNKIKGYYYTHNKIIAVVVFTNAAHALDTTTPAHRATGAVRVRSKETNLWNTRALCRFLFVYIEYLKQIKRA